MTSATSWFENWSNFHFWLASKLNRRCISALALLRSKFNVTFEQAIETIKKCYWQFFWFANEKVEKKPKNGFFWGLLKSNFSPLWAVFRKKLCINKSWVIRCRKLPFLKFFIYLSSKLRYWASRLDANQK